MDYSRLFVVIIAHFPTPDAHKGRHYMFDGPTLPFHLALRGGREEAPIVADVAKVSNVAYVICQIVLEVAEVSHVAYVNCQI
jgi:hypothetical protein